MATSAQLYRGLIHFHSCFSPDSLTSIDVIIAAAKRLSLDFMILTDHESVLGSMELAGRARKAGLPLEVPLAAEYRTDHGDLIAAFIEQEIVSRDLNGFVAEVRQQNGIVLLPHPFAHHHEVELLARQADLIEVFNGRSSATYNRAAAALAARHNKPRYWASDAHLLGNLSRVVLTIEVKGNLRDSLMHGAIRALRCEPSQKGEMLLSQAIKVAKTMTLARGLRRAFWPLR